MNFFNIYVEILEGTVLSKEFIYSNVFLVKYLNYGTNSLFLKEILKFNIVVGFPSWHCHVQRMEGVGKRVEDLLERR